MEKFKVGDIVKVNDGSSSVRLDDINGDRYIGLSKNDFEVIKTDVTEFVYHGTGGRCHDIIIKEKGNGNGLYLHSSRYVSLVEPERFRFRVIEYSEHMNNSTSYMLTRTEINTARDFLHNLENDSPVRSAS